MISARLLFLSLAISSAITTANARAQEAAPGLSTFGATALTKYPTAAGSLYCAPGLCQTNEAPTTAGPDGEGVVVSSHLLRLSKRAAFYRVYCTEGSSGDPACNFVPAGAVDNGYAAPGIDGEVFVVPGDGCLYVSQTANANFVTKSKFCPLQGSNALARVGPTLRRVDLASHSNVQVALHTEPNIGAQRFHQIPPQTKVTVVVAETIDAVEWYLVSDAFGIVGWVSAEELGVTQCGTASDGKGIEGLCFNGD